MVGVKQGVVMLLVPSVVDFRLKKIAELAEGIAVTKNKFEARRENVWPEEEELEIRWFRRNGEKIYTIACGPCGNNRLYIWQNGMRCRNCNFFHAYVTFHKLQKRIYTLTRFNDKLIQKVKQPERPKGNILVDVKRGKVIDLGGNPQEQLQRYLCTI